MQLNPNSNNKQMKLSLANQIQRIFFVYQYNNINVTKWTHQKHLGYLLDSKLVFNIHVEQKLENAKKTLSKSHT